MASSPSGTPPGTCRTCRSSSRVADSRGPTARWGSPRASSDLASMLTYILRRIGWTAHPARGRQRADVLHLLHPAVGRSGGAAGGTAGAPELIAQIHTTLGLDRPLYEQFYTYIRDVVLHFDFGYSFQSGQDVRERSSQRLPATISLALGAVDRLARHRAAGRHDLGDQGAARCSIASRWAARCWRSPRRSTGWGSSSLYLFCARHRRDRRSSPAAARYRPADRGPAARGSTRCCCRGSCSPPRSPRSTRGCCAPTSSRCMDEDYIRTARAKGAARAARDLAPRRARARSRRS